MAEGYEEDIGELEGLNAEDLVNLLGEPEPDFDQDVGKEDGGDDSEERLLAAMADLEDDVYRTGRRITTTDVQRTAGRHGLSARDAARLELRAEEDGLVEPDDGGTRPQARDRTGSLDSFNAWFRAASRFPLLTAREEVALARGYEAGRRATEELAAGRAMGDDLRRKLEQNMERGQRARLALICSNLRLVASVAGRFHSSGMEREDVMQEGIVGLMRAVERFDWRLGYKLSTYATYWIRQATQRGIDNQGRLIRLPVHMLDKLRGVRREARRMELRFGREPTIFELSESVGVDPAELAFLRDIEEVVSLDKPVGADPDGATLGELLAARQDTVEDVVERDLQSKQISRWLDRLGDRDRKVIELRFGLRDDQPSTLEEIGQEMGVTRERIRQIEVKALEKLSGIAQQSRWTEGGGS